MTSLLIFALCQIHYMVEWFDEQLEGFCFIVNWWLGINLCFPLINSPILIGDVHLLKSIINF